jgi:hypothetical protein
MLGGGSKTDSNISSRGNPGTIRAGPSYVTELPKDFCDLLLELADAGAEFVLVGGHHTYLASGISNLRSTAASSRPTVAW